MNELKRENLKARSQRMNRMNETGKVGQCATRMRAFHGVRTTHTETKHAVRFYTFAAYRQAPLLPLTRNQKNV